MPLLPAILIAFIVPESVRWLTAMGRVDEARRTVARLFKVPVHSLPLPLPPAGTPPSANFLELWWEPCRFWLTVIIWFGASTASYGVFLWGPTIVALLLGATPQEAARILVYVSGMGILGRTLFAVMVQRIGRRRCGEIMGYGMTVTLLAVGLFHDSVYEGAPRFIPLIILAALFFDGGFANIGPYSAEIFPVRLSAHGVGLAQVANGIGKIAGPLCFALIAGTATAVSAEATSAAALSIFVFLAGCGLSIGLAFMFLGVETHGKAIALNETPALEKRPAI